MQSKLKKRAVALALLPLAFGAAAAGETVRLSGAASAVDSLIAPAKAAVERITGDTLVVDRNNAGRGLIDLADGRCDAALASADLPTVVGAAKAAGREVDIATLRMAVVRTDPVVFVVHPAAGVQRLTLAQVAALHTGQVTNWKQLGGADLPVAVVTDIPSSATRGLIKQAVLKGADYVAGARPVAIEQVSAEVAATPGAIGGLGAGFVGKAAVGVLQTDEKVERPLGLVTIGAPSAKVARVIDALKQAAPAP